jgi:hypothetical protein
MHPFLWGVVGAVAVLVVLLLLHLLANWALDRAVGDELVKLGWSRTRPGAFPDPPPGRLTFDKLRDLQAAKKRVTSGSDEADPRRSHGPPTSNP